ncbi:MAG TPA: ATP-binding cassette domain-containing protein [Thermomicrobiales bacterium]|nr:ATP-binding cassette domain-containing protein [Thermomicrobiales bacterium]
MAIPAFTLKNVRFRTILDIPRLEIRSGAVTCIVGKSGSGKTTLMKLLNRMVTPDSGTILYGDTPVEEIDPVQLRRQVVMLGQTPVMFDGTIRDNLLVGLGFAGRDPVPDDELRRLVDLMELGKPLDADASELSGGEKQRVALARVLAMRPEVALLDEPSSALDAGTERVIIDRVVSAAKQGGVTLVIVTHNRAMAERIADDLIEINEGRVDSPVRAES